MTEVLRPQSNLDSAYFWEGAAAGELRIRRCTACGALRHPPGPACPDCHALERDFVVSAGQGIVYSYAVHHHPPVPGQDLPILLVLVELPEGVRMIGRLKDTQPDEIQIGMPVRASYTVVDEDLTLVDWERA